MRLSEYSIINAKWNTYEYITSEARLFFRAGKARDGYFDNDNLIIEVDKAIDIFEGKTNGSQLVFSSSTMLQVIKNVHRMHYLHRKC